jgi:hypothetical protein
MKMTEALRIQKYLKIDELVRLIVLSKPTRHIGQFTEKRVL